MLFWDRDCKPTIPGWDLVMGMESEDGNLIADLVEDGNGGWRADVAVRDDRGVWFHSSSTGDYPALDRLLGSDWRDELARYEEWALDELGDDVD